MTMVMAAAGMLRGADGEVTDGPVGGEPVAVAESATDPWDRSSAVTV